MCEEGVRSQRFGSILKAKSKPQAGFGVGAQFEAIYGKYNSTRHGAIWASSRTLRFSSFVLYLWARTPLGCGRVTAQDRDPKN